MSPSEESDAREAASGFWLVDTYHDYRIKLYQRACRESEASHKSREQQHEIWRDSWINSPLQAHSLCTSCNWYGVANKPSIQNRQSTTGLATGAAGASATVGGGAVASAGVAGMLAGTLLIIIGLVTLPCLGLGLIPIIIGALMLFAGSTATTTGAMVGTGGALAATSGANATAEGLDRKARTAAQPNVCPLCGNPGLIPVTSHGAKKIIDADSELHKKLASEAEDIRNSARRASVLVRKQPSPPTRRSSLDQLKCIGILIILVAATSILSLLAGPL